MDSHPPVMQSKKTRRFFPTFEMQIHDPSLVSRIFLVDGQEGEREMEAICFVGGRIPMCENPEKKVRRCCYGIVKSS